MDVEGATALITGASSGIGAALARAVVARGATVGIVARRRDKLEAVLADCCALNPDCRHWVVDLDDVEAAEALALEAWDALGGLDVLVNNAAIPKRRPAARLTVDDVETTMRVNFMAPARMTLAVLPRMLARGSGVVVNVSSMGGRLGIAHEAAYCASKFALCGWSEALAIDLDGSGVDVRLSPAPSPPTSGNGRGRTRPCSSPRSSRPSWSPTASSPPSRVTPSSTTCPTSSPW